MWSALSKLSETYREPLVLYVREGESIDRVASTLGLSRDAVKQRVSRGRSELRESLDRIERHLARSGPRATVSCFPITVAAGPHTQTAALTPRVP